MRISGPGQPAMPATIPSSGTSAATGTATSAAPAAAPLQSAALQPALAALRDMPEIDAAKVQALRDALARGEVALDTDRLAGLIERFHRSRDE